MTITLYGAPGSCAFAPLVALEQAGAAFDLRIVSLAGGDQRRPDYLAIHPLGRVPALIVDDAVLTETIALLSWIDATYPRAGLLPVDPLERARAYEIMGWIASTVHVALAGVRRPERFAEDAGVNAALAETGRAAFDRALGRMERFAARPDAWLVGNRFGVVDAYSLVVKRWGDSLGFDSAAYPAWHAKLVAALAEPAVVRAFARETAPPA